MFKTKLLPALAALALASNAGAVTQTFGTTLDLTLAGFTPTGFSAAGSGAFSSTASFALAIGDTLDYTIDFKNNQSLTLTNAGLIWGFLYSGAPCIGVTGTGTLALLDSSGNAFLTSNSKTDSESCVHFGQQFGPSDYTSFPTTVTFYGLHYIGTIDGYDDGITTTRDYSQPELVIDSGSLVANVPEPASWALMISGFGLVGGALRSRRRAFA